MAYASSKLEAQEVFIKLCDLCEDEEDVKWFCKDCVQNLCDRCRKIHLKTIACKNHQIVSILEGVAITKKKVSNLCQDHDDLFLYFCRTCDKNICSLCLSMIHKKHDFVDLRQLQLELQGKLDDILKKKRLEQTEMIKNINELDECENRCKVTMSERCSFLDGRIEAIKRTADEEGKNLRLSLQSATDRQLKEIQEQKQKVEEREKTYVEQFELIQQDQRLQTASTFHEFVKSSTVKLQSLKPLSYTIPRSSTFSCGDMNKELIRDMICKYIHVPDTTNNFERNRSNNSSDEIKSGFTIRSALKVLRVHRLKEKIIEKSCQCICESPCGNFLIGSDGYVYKVTPDFSTTIHQRRIIYGCHQDIACMKCGHVVVTNGRSTSYFEWFTLENNFMKSMNLSPMYAFNVAITNQDEFVVTVNNGSEYATKSSLVFFSKEGKIKEIEMNTKIAALCIDHKGENFVISDGNSPFLTILDRNGNALRRIEVTKSYIKRLACDRYGNIIGVSRYEKEIYVISENWRIKGTFSVECDKVINDICFDRYNNLVILVDYEKVILVDHLGQKC